MKLPWGWITVGAAMISACATAPGIDRPVPLDAGYAAREVAAGKPADRCGPEFISDHLPQSLVSLMGPLLDGPFRPVCARHDACYELREQTQAWCDDRMRTEMIDICNAGRTESSAEAALCRFRAGIYASLVDNSFGAYSYHGEPGGRIAAVELAEAPEGDVKICTTAENPTPLLQEYVVEMRAANGKRIDSEPGFGERSVRAGGSAVICVGTSGSPFWTLGLIKGPVEIVLLADDPDSLALRHDRVAVDRRVLDRAALDFR
jgi:hypothetical protein